MSKQLTIFDAVGDTDLVSPTNQLGDTKKQAFERYLNRGTPAAPSRDNEPSITVKKYKPNGRKTEYYRLDFRVGRRVKSVHIPGGNVNSRLANYRVGKLQELIDRGAELGYVLAMIETYRSRGNGRNQQN